MTGEESIWGKCEGLLYKHICKKAEGQVINRGDRIVRIEDKKQELKNKNRNKGIGRDVQEK